MTGTSTTTGMRLALTVCAGFLAAACGSSPTSPNAIPTATGPAFAGSPASDGATRLNFSVDLTVPAYPVCALTPVGAGTLHGEGVLTVVLRSVTDPNGGTRIGSSIHGHGTATDATGARWIWSDADLNNELFASGNTSPNSFSQTVHEGFHVIGPKGQKIMVIGTFHITMVNGTTIVEVEHGNHEEAETCESGFALTPLP
ncbi:MAG TPA: hypothetical protein VFO21_23975 [Vicinamibacterales bacterium]|nr:hypothetical protein [Vicinamibacterales bacterium]